MKYDLVFEGGGAKGMVFVGAMQVFEAQGNTFGRLLGASAGAITAALLAAGYETTEMLAALEEQVDGHSVFSGFLQKPALMDETAMQSGAIRTLLRNLDIPLVPDFVEEKLDDAVVALLAKDERFCHILSFVERGGWYAADTFIDWMSGKLDAGTYGDAPRHFSGMTLAQFFAATHVDLTLVAADLSGGRMLVLNHRTAPDCPLVWAVRMSMNIPLLWQEVIWQEAWGTYCGQKLAGHRIVDGGLLSNFPLELFVSNLPGVTAVMGPKTSERVLGFLIDESLPVPGAPGATKPEGLVSTLQTVQRFQQLLNTLLSAHDKMVIDAFERFVVRLPAQGYGTTEFDMTPERRDALVAAGHTAAAAYFDVQEAALLDPQLDFSAGPSTEAMTNADKVAGKLLGVEVAFLAGE